MLRRQPGEQIVELRVRGDPGEGLALEPVACFQKSRRDRAGLTCSPRREPGLGLLRQVEPVGRESHRILSFGRVLEARQHLAHANEGLLPVRRALDFEADSVDEVALGAAEPVLELLGIVGGIGVRRQRDDADVESLRSGELHPAKRRRLAGRVAVEAEPELVRQPRELLQLPLGERGAHRGHDGLVAGLPQSEDVGVALDHDRTLLFRDRRSRLVEPVEEVALAEELALG